MKIDRKWLVIVIRDDEPAVLVPFEFKEAATTYYKTTIQNWSEVYLCQIVKKPRDR